MPPPVPTAAIPPTAIALLLIHLSWMLHLLTMTILGGQPLNAARNVPAVKMKFEDVENYMVEKAKKESLELVQDLKSKEMKVLTQKMSKM